MKIESIFSVMTVLLIALSACTAEPSAPDEAVTLIIRFEASEQGVEEFAQIMDGVSDAMAAEPGFVSAKVFRDIDEPNVFVLEEVWATKELHQDHFTRINQSGDWSHINSLLIEKPEMGYFRSM
ncbi:antibiotic biosynthesis monooxygenase [Altererythrobacter arenosus]|uniref:Antibiotic biosynthesis monooxygenase n=1 Tax=Altererythrobacter arenosus TaxID=3032592 RepID=A0ABY8FWA3_9SPHN|nr:antibiotic biosynthesis monooxygenase [Altererythrobacter sp. CAU 1644]WFL76309.1 antibiotic biosynthesis monooxygenase [Altererythrobacter sp. CAU 1644]